MNRTSYICLIIGMVTGFLFADDLIFPPDPERTIEQKKPRPMVVQRELVGVSGSLNKSSSMMQDRGSKVTVKAKQGEDQTKKNSAKKKASVEKQLE